MTPNNSVAPCQPKISETRQHSPLPWILDGTSVYYLDWDGVSYEGKGKNYQRQLTNRFWFSMQGSPKRVPTEELEANAAFIVEAVNSHASLKAALAEAIAVFEGMCDDEIEVELLPRLRAALEAKPAGEMGT